MKQKLAVTVNTAFGLAFDIERAPERRSGFKPAQFDLGSGKELFGDLRLDGFAALLRIGFAEKLIVVGGDEGRYRNERPVVNQAAQIREMLVRDFGISPDRVSSIASNSNTIGNIAAIAEMRKRDMVDWQYHGIWWHRAIVSNLYHLHRVFLDLAEANLPIQIYPAEAFWLLEDENRKNELIKRLGGGPLAERMAEEAQGIAHKLRGTYKPRIDTPPAVG